MIISVDANSSWYKTSMSKHVVMWGDVTCKKDLFDSLSLNCKKARQGLARARLLASSIGARNLFELHPRTNVTHENRQSQRETSIRTIHKFYVNISIDMLVSGRVYNIPCATTTHPPTHPPILSWTGNDVTWRLLVRLPFIWSKKSSRAGTTNLEFVHYNVELEMSIYKWFIFNWMIPNLYMGMSITV